MWMDIKNRGLEKGYFVNNAGYTTKLSPDWAFHCGRKVSDGNATWDGNCGPNNGPNCGSCLTLSN